MSVRAKFVCTEVTKQREYLYDKGYKFSYRAKFSPVTSGSDENKEFFAATPYGSIELGTYVDDHFEPGKEYYLDFSEANVASNQLP